MRKILLAFVLALAPSLALAQQSVSPWIINGSGATPNCPVGNVTATSCPLPVTMSGGGEFPANTSTTGSITIQDTGSTTTSNLAGSSQQITGTPTADSYVQLATPSGFQSAVIQITGTWTGTIQFEASVDGGVTWTPYGAHVRGSAISVGNTTLNGTFFTTVSAGTQVRARATAAITGSATILIVDSVADNNVYVANGVKILSGDGQNLQARVTPASVSPGTTDNALVVSTSPNSIAPGPSSASTSGLTPVNSSAYETSHVIKASAGNLYSFEVTVDSTLAAAAWEFLIFNSTTAPAAGTVAPIKCYQFPAGTTTFAGAFPVPIYFSTGISMTVSTATSCLTQTDSAHGFFSGDAK